MKRFELTSNGVARFVELEVQGNVLDQRAGRVGSDGRRTTRRFETRAQAQQGAEKVAQAHEKRGYQLSLDTEALLEKRNPALEAAIIERPEEPAGYQIYADWLQDEGEPRGALIALQSASSPSSDKAEEQLFKAHPQLRPRRMHELRRKKNAAREITAYPLLSWFCGFITAARIARPSSKSPCTMRDLSWDLLSSPSSRFLRSLWVGADGEGPSYDFSPVVEVLLKTRPQHLSTLILSEVPKSPAELTTSTLGALHGLCEALPGLTDLTLRAGSMELEPLDHAQLTYLKIQSAGMTEPNVRALTEAETPRLARLELSTGQSPLPSLGGLFFEARLASLKHLGITHTEGTEALLDELLRSRLLKQLEVLDLSQGSIDDEAATRLLSGDSALQHLSRLDLRGNYLSEDLLPSLTGLAQHVLLEDQRKPLKDTGARVLQSDIPLFSPDARSIKAAQVYATSARWSELGQDSGILWGTCQGTDDYECYVEVSAEPPDRWEAGCLCPSSKHPCKHTIALLLLAAKGEEIPNSPVPEGLVMVCQDNHLHYDNTWE